MSEPTWTQREGKALVLRTCEQAADGTMLGYGGFVWPQEPGTPVEAPDWDPRPFCGKGLHGLLWGMGNPGYLNRGVESVYMVVEVDMVDVVWVSDDKVKFPRCVVIYIGDLPACARILTAYAPGVALRRDTVGDLSRFPHHAYVLDTERTRPDCPHGCDEEYDDCPHVARAEVIEVPIGPVSNILSSEIIDDPARTARFGAGGEGDGPLHTVMLDLDVPARLIPSSTGGHYHLYIDVPMPWGKYKRLLKTLAHVGIIEPGYYKAACSRKATFLRLPWIKKPKAAGETPTSESAVPAWAL